LIESKDAIFLENTNKITHIEEIKLLQDKDRECQASVDTQLEDEQEIEVQHSGE